MTTTAASDAELDALTFEQLVDRLDELTGQLSRGDLGIEAAADLYEQAERVHRAATARLAAVQARIDALRPTAPAD